MRLGITLSDHTLTNIMNREDFNFQLQELRTQLKAKRNEINDLGEQIERLKAEWRYAQFNQFDTPLAEIYGG